jgi:hypothetical protein
MASSAVVYSFKEHQLDQANARLHAARAELREALRRHEDGDVIDALIQYARDCQTEATLIFRDLRAQRTIK